MEAAINHYESLGLIFDHFEAKINSDNVAMIYMPVFKQPIEPNISIPEYKKQNNDYSFKDTYEPISLAASNLKLNKQMNTPMGYFESYNEQKGFYEKKILTVADFIQLPKNIQDKYVPGAQAWREIIAKTFPDLDKNLYVNIQ
jgi:hypothetical protein